MKRLLAWWASLGDRLVEWWAQLDDRQLLGVQLCFCTTGNKWLHFRLTRRVEMFHNGERFIPGVQIQVGLLVLQLSSARNWD